MADLEGPDGERVLLRALHGVGRAPDSALQLPDAQVSSLHALFRWTGRQWEVRDLGSRNGTWVDGRRLGSGESAPLTVGTTLAFGSPGRRWRVRDDSPPHTAAVPEDGGMPVEPEGKILALPSAEHPLVTVYATPAGWVVDRDGRTEVVSDGTVLVVEGRRWRLSIPAAAVGTVEAGDAPVDLSRVALSFTVSRDEEHVECVGSAGSRSFDLGTRSHHYLLLTLARARLADRARGVPPAEEGWLYQDDVLKGLATTFNTLQVHVFRARRQLGEVGVINAADIVQRRTDSGQIRLGVADLAVRVG